MITQPRLKIRPAKFEKVNGRNVRMYCNCTDHSMWGITENYIMTDIGCDYSSDARECPTCDTWPFFVFNQYWNESDAMEAMRSMNRS